MLRINKNIEMKWFKNLQASSNWNIKKVSKSAANPTSDGGVNFTIDVNGVFSYPYLHIVVLFESKPKKDALNGFYIINKNTEKVGTLLRFNFNDNEVTLVYKGDWANTEGLSLCGLDQVNQITNVIAEPLFK